jgi:hypothetical protein
MGELSAFSLSPSLDNSAEEGGEGFVGGKPLLRRVMTTRCTIGTLSSRPAAASISIAGKIGMR